MRVAVITPYYETPLDWMRQCHESVLAQTHPCVQILVADGVPVDELDTWNAQHIRLPQRHADYGDTPRTVGSMSAIGQGFDAITYLDADNWFAPEHIESLVRLHEETGADVCLSSRDLHRMDGSRLGPCRESDGENFADTSTMFLTRRAFGITAQWALMNPRLHAIDDRVIFHAIRTSKLKRAFTGRRTLAYRTSFQVSYRQFGEEPPPGAKTDAHTDEAYRYLLETGGPDLRPRRVRKAEES